MKCKLKCVALLLLKCKFHYSRVSCVIIFMLFMERELYRKHSPFLERYLKDVICILLFGF